MSNSDPNRREFLTRTATGVTAASLGLLSGCAKPKPLGPRREVKPHEDVELVGPRAPYRGPNVIVVRFGGGVRRRETVQYPQKTW